MKKIIKGKMYDTETARMIGVWSNAGSWRDFSHMEEALYRKKTGEYFLYGEGGPMTKYAEEEGLNSWTGGIRIMPMTYKEATEWAEEHLTAEEYESAFGPVTEDESKVSVTFRLTARNLETLRQKADAEGMGVSEYIDNLISGLQ